MTGLRCAVCGSQRDVNVRLCSACEEDLEVRGEVSTTPLRRLRGTPVAPRRSLRESRELSNRAARNRTKKEELL